MQVRASADRQNKSPSEYNKRKLQHKGHKEDKTSDP